MLAKYDRNRIDPLESFFNSAFSSFLTNRDETYGLENLREPQVRKEDGQYRINVAIPGYKKDEVKVEISDDTLTVTAEKKREKKAGEKGEAAENYGHFSQSFTIPSGIKADKADAKLEDGILEILIPEPEEPKSELIKIK